MVPSGNYPLDSGLPYTSTLSFSAIFPGGCAGTAIIYWTLIDNTTQSVVASDAFPLGCGGGCTTTVYFPSLYPGSYEFLGQYTFEPVLGSTTSGLWPGFFTVDQAEVPKTMPNSTMTIYVDSPVNILVTAPNNDQAGFYADGSSINQINGAILDGPCSPLNQAVFVTIPNPTAGQYQITAFPSCAASNGSPYTIDIQKGTSGTLQSYSSTATQGGATLSFSASLSSGGQVTISSAFPTPEFPFGELSMVLVALMALFSFGLLSRQRKLHDR